MSTKEHALGFTKPESSFANAMCVYIYHFGAWWAEKVTLLCNFSGFLSITLHTCLKLLIDPTWALKFEGNAHKIKNGLWESFGKKNSLKAYHGKLSDRECVSIEWLCYSPSASECSLRSQGPLRPEKRLLLRLLFMLLCYIWWYFS